MKIKQKQYHLHLISAVCASLVLVLASAVSFAQTVVTAPSHLTITDNATHIGNIIIEPDASLTFGAMATLDGDLTFNDGAGHLIGTVSFVGDSRRFSYIGSGVHDVVTSHFMHAGTGGVFEVNGGPQGVQFNGDVTGFDVLQLHNQSQADFYGTLNNLQNISVSGGGQLALSSVSITQDISVSGLGSRFVSDGYASVTARDIMVINDGLFDATNDTISAARIVLDGGGRFNAGGAILDTDIVLEQAGAFVFDENTQFNGDLFINTTHILNMCPVTLHMGGGNQAVTLSGIGADVHFIGFDGGAGTADQFNLNGASGDVTIDGVFENFESVTIDTHKTLFVNGPTSGLGIVNVSGQLDITGTQDSFHADEIVIGQGGALVTGGTLINADLDIQLGALPIIGPVIMGAGDGHDVTMRGILTSSQTLNTDFDGGGGAHDTLRVTAQGPSFSTILTGSIHRFENIIMGAAGLSDTQLTLEGELNDIDRLSIINGALTYNSAHTLSVGNIDFLNTGADIGVLTWAQGTLDAHVTGNTFNQSITVLDGGSLTVGAAATFNGIERLDLGDDSVFVFNGSGVFDGAVRGTDGKQTIDVNAGVFTNMFETGAGADVVTLANAQLAGGYDGGSDGDVVSIDGGVVTLGGSIQGVQRFNIAGAALVYDSANIQEIISVIGGSDADTLTIKKGGFRGFVDLGLGQNTITINTQDSVVLGNVFDTGGNGLLLEHGDLELTRDVVVDTYSYNAADTRLRFAILDSNDYASLTLTGTHGLDIAGDVGDVLDIMLLDPTLVQSGDSFTLLHDMGAGNLAARFAISSSQASLFTRFVEDDISADVYRVTLQTSLDGVFSTGTQQDIGSSNFTNVAQAVLAAPVSSSSLGQVRAAIASAPTAQAAGLMLDPLMPASDTGYQQGGLAVAAQASQSVAARLGGLRSGGGMASGDVLPTQSNMWGQALGAVATQSEDKNIIAYDAHTIGFTVGADRLFEAQNTVVGIVASYGATHIENKNANRTARDIDSYQVGLYADHNMGADVFIIGQMSYILSRIDQIRHDVGAVGTHAIASYNSHQFGSQLALGQTWNISGLHVTPKISTNYNYIMTDAYTEQGAGALNLDVRSDDTQTLNIGAGVEFAWPHARNDGALFAPHFHVGYGRDVISGAIDTVAHFAGGGGNFVTQSAAPTKDTGMLGAGFTYQSSGAWRIETDYNLTARKHYMGHAGSVRGIYRF